MPGCSRCGDWGTVRHQAVVEGRDASATAVHTWALPCPDCRPVEALAASGGEQGLTAEELELYRLRRRVAELEADVAALRAGRVA